jgi:small subunit ribosomal protein S20
LRRRTVNRRTRSEAKTLVQQASDIALGRFEGDGPVAVAAAISALDKAAEKGIIHPNNAARRKSRLMTKVNAAHLLDDVEGPTTTAATKKRTTASKTAQRKKVAAAKASKAAAGKAADRPRTAAGKAKVAVTRASRESAAARRRAKDVEDDEG